MARPSYPSDEVDKLLLRFPAGMREALKEHAQRNGRSLNSELIKRLQDTLDYDEYVARHASAPEPNEADYGGLSFGDHLKTHPAPGAVAQGTLDTILDELRFLRSSILDVRHLPDGRRQVEFAPATRTDDENPLPDPAPMPAKDDPGYDEAMLKQVETIAARYGFDLVKKDAG